MENLRKVGFCRACRTRFLNSPTRMNRPRGQFSENHMKCITRWEGSDGVNIKSFPPYRGWKLDHLFMKQHHHKYLNQVLFEKFTHKCLVSMSSGLQKIQNKSQHQSIYSDNPITCEPTFKCPIITNIHKEINTSQNKTCTQYANLTKNSDVKKLLPFKLMCAVEEKLVNTIFSRIQT